MREKDLRNLAHAFVQESVAAERNRLAAHRAEVEEDDGAAMMLKALARAQEIHADKALMLLRGKMGDTRESLEWAAKEREQNLPIYESAALETEGPARTFLQYFFKTTGNHIKFLGKLQEGQSHTYHVCTICGFISRDYVPDDCPVCGALKEKYEKVT